MINIQYISSVVFRKITSSQLTNIGQLHSYVKPGLTLADLNSAHRECLYVLKLSAFRLTIYVYYLRLHRRKSTTIKMSSWNVKGILLLT